MSAAGGSEPDWKPEAARQARARLDGNRVALENVRDTRWPDPDEPFEVRWDTRSYELGALRRLWFLLEPFHPTFEFIAHTFISFEFEDDFLALSIEARLTRDQSYSIVEGLVGNYALSYLFGDERDLLLQRTRYKEHQLYLYPLVTPPIEVRALFLNTLAKANAMHERPARYNSVRNNCTTTLRKHANQVRPGSFPPFIWADVLPGRSDRVLFDKGWIATDVASGASIDALRERHAVHEAAVAAADDPDFSRRIRAERGLAEPPAG